MAMIAASFPAEARALSPDRLVYLDNLRAGAMILGIFVHTTTLTEFGPLRGVALVSDFFRMAAFFLVSGYLSVLLLAQRDTAAYLRHRLIALLVPLVAGLVLLNPLTLWLVARHHNDLAALGVGFREVMAVALAGGRGLEGQFVWHLHLWFLISLSVYVLLAPALSRALQAPAVGRGLDATLGRLPAWAVAPALALATAAAVAGARILVKLAVDPVLGDVWLIRVTLAYLPFFVLGMLLFLRGREWACVHRIDPVTLGLGIGLYLGARALAEAGGPQALADLGRILATALIRCGIIFALLWLFRALFDRPGAASRLVSESIYSVYLFHYLAIYAVATLLGLGRTGSAAEFFAIAGLVLALTLALHLGAIAQSPLLRFLFNGKGR